MSISKSPLAIAQEAAPSPETIGAFADGFEAYNSRFAGPENETPLWLIARDAEGAVCGGLKGQTSWDWLYVDWLWIADAHQRTGAGSELLARAEAFARSRNCAGVFLNTYSFQAPEFYPRHGYTEFGRLEGFPTGHRQIWFAKRF